MTKTTVATSTEMAGDTGRHRGLPEPRRGARWRWSAPHRAGGAGASRPMASGRVIAVRDSRVVVRGRSGTISTVVETASTSYTTLGRGHAAATSSTAALRVGDFVGVRGIANRDGTVRATSVTVFSGSPFRSAGVPPRTRARGTAATR